MTDYERGWNDCRKAAAGFVSKRWPAQATVQILAKEIATLPAPSEEPCPGVECVECRGTGWVSVIESFEPGCSYPAGEECQKCNATGRSPSATPNKEK